MTSMLSPQCVLVLQQQASKLVIITATLEGRVLQSFLKLPFFLKKLPPDFIGKSVMNKKKVLFTLKEIESYFVTL